MDTQGQAQCAIDTVGSVDWKPGPRTYFGQMLTDVWYCALVKGQGKVLFNSNEHPEDQRRHAIDLVLTPLARTGSQEYQIKRELIAESADFAKIVKPSLAAISVDLRALNGQFVQAQLVPTGTYTDKHGETKTRSMLKFVARYPDEATCQAAADAFFSQHAGQNESGQPQQAGNAAPAQTAPGSNGGPASPERATAAKFLPLLWQNAKAMSGGTDTLGRFEQLLKSNSLTSRHFTLTSPEVQQVVLAG